MSNREKSLPPIARERLARIGELTREEKENMIDSERVESLLSGFYQGQIDPRKLVEEAEGRTQAILLEGSPEYVRSRARFEPYGELTEEV